MRNKFLILLIFLDVVKHWVVVCRPLRLSVYYLGDLRSHRGWDRWILDFNSRICQLFSLPLPQFFHKLYK
jgi:hypothetical protein